VSHTGRAPCPRRGRGRRSWGKVGDGGGGGETGRRCRSPLAMGVALCGQPTRAWTRAALPVGVAGAAARAVNDARAVGGVGARRRRGGRSATRRARCRCAVATGVAVAVAMGAAARGTALLVEGEEWRG